MMQEALASESALQEASAPGTITGVVIERYYVKIYEGAETGKVWWNGGVAGKDAPKYQVELVALVESSHIVRHDAPVARYAVPVILRGVVPSDHRVKGIDSSYEIAVGGNLFHHAAERQDPARESADVAVLDGDAEDVSSLAADKADDCLNARCFKCWCRRAIVRCAVANDGSRNAEAVEIDGNVVRLDQDSGAVGWNDKISNQLVAARCSDFEGKPTSIQNTGLIDENGLVNILCCENWNGCHQQNQCKQP
jgi:hypothetical protein